MEGLATDEAFPSRGPQMNLRPHIWLLATYREPMREINCFKMEESSVKTGERKLFHVFPETQLTSLEWLDATKLSMM